MGVPVIAQLSELPFPKPKIEMGLPAHKRIAAWTASAPVEGMLPMVTRPEAARMDERSWSQARGLKRVALPK